MATSIRANWKENAEGAALITRVTFDSDGSNSEARLQSRDELLREEEEEEEDFTGSSSGDGATAACQWQSSRKSSSAGLRNRSWRRRKRMSF